jgi:hypothetical protein
MVVNAFKSVTEEDLGFQQPEEVHVNIIETEINPVDPEVAKPVEVDKPVEEDEPVGEPVEPPQTLWGDPEEEAMKKKKENLLRGLDVPLTMEWVQ